MSLLRYILIIPAALLIALAGLVQADNSGLIYGTITSKDGKAYTGTLRWGSQECFWDDLFNADKNDNPWSRYGKEVKYDNEINRDRVRIFGMTITEFNHFGSYDHLFICRFGDIKRLETLSRGRTNIIMKSGLEYEVSGSGDVGETIQVADASLGKLKINWDEIRTIEFAPAPASAKAAGYRLKGKVVTREMDLNGYVMWDAEECLSSDILDGESEVGTMAIEFANIRSITRESSQSCTVKLKDGREFELRGTNDVNSENRGIYVADERFGKIEVPWDELKEVDYLDDDGTTGNSYDSYVPAKELHGTVTAWGNKQYTGRLVFDLDEEATSDILNGKLDEMDFNTPFDQIVSITPRGKHSAEVEFTSGQKLRLEDSQDVTDTNYGLLIFKDQDDRDPKAVSWEDIEKITFSK